MKGKTSKKRASKKVHLLEKQFEMPAGFHSDDSQVATLRDVIDPQVATKQLSDLTLEQRAELVVKRLELQPKFELAMIGAGMVDKARAITEVKGKTKVGKLLIEIEHQMIRNLLEQAQKQAAPKPAQHRAKRKPTKKRS